MSVEVVLGLTLEVLAVAIVLVSLRRHRFGFLGALFICLAIAYNGLGELLQYAFPNDGRYRFVVPSSAVAPWLPIVGAAMLAFAVAYVVTLSVSRVQARQTTSWWPSATLMCAVAGGFWALAVGAAVLSPDVMRYWGGGLIQQFLLVAVTTATILVVRQAGPLGTVVALLAQAAALSLTGQRSDFIAATVVVIWAAVLLRHPISWRVLVPFAIAVASVAVLISATRNDVGRSFQTGDLAVRAAAFQAGAGTIRSGETSGIAGDIIYRLDGNAWAAYVRDQQELHPLASISDGLGYDLKLAIPGFVNTSKLSTPEWQRSEEWYFDHTYGIPTTPDWLPTLFGSAFAYGGAWGLLGFALVLGVVLGRLDVWLHGGLTFPSLLIGIGVALSIARYEGGFDGVVITMRGALLVWLVARLADALHATLRSAQPARRSFRVVSFVD